MDEFLHILRGFALGFVLTFWGICLLLSPWAGYLKNYDDDSALVFFLVAVGAVGGLLVAIDRARGN